MRSLPDDQDLHRPMWARLRGEARSMAERDPFLSRIVSPTLLAAASLQDALAGRLAAALAGVECPAKDLCALLRDGLEIHPSIVIAAARDLFAMHQNDPVCPTYIHAFLNYKAFHAVQVHRIAHALWNDDRRELAAWLSNRASAALGPDIHPAARLGAGIMLDHGSGIVIGETAVVEDNVTILQNVTLGGTGKTLGDRHPKVREGAMIGAGATVLGNIEVGAYSKIGAGSVVLKDVPPGHTAVGVPARSVRRYQPRATHATDRNVATSCKGEECHHLRPEQANPHLKRVEVSPLRATALGHAAPKKENKI